MPKPIAHCQICPRHHCAVTCVGDEEQGLLLSGTCPMGGETITVDMSSSLNAPAPGTVRATGVGGVHDPMATVARGIATPANEPIANEEEIDPTTGLPYADEPVLPPATEPIHADPAAVPEGYNEPIVAAEPIEETVKKPVVFDGK